MTQSGRNVATHEELKAHILAKYATVYAFCRDTPEVKRSTVYQLLRGKYPGNAAKQIQRIEAALAGVAVAPATRPTLTEAEACAVLQETKCAHCRKLDKRACPDCRRQTEREAAALAEYVRTREAT